MIEVLVKSSVRPPVDRQLLARAAKAALKGRFTLGFVSIAVIGASSMRRMNREMLGHDYVTDVLSFDHGDSHEGRQIEIVVCATFARQQAQRRNIRESEELARYVIHGCLHCAGFSDATEPKRKRMWKRQEAILRRVLKGAPV
jgi:probable rRNA maturation factor